MNDEVKTIITVTPETGNRFEKLRKAFEEHGEGDDISDASRFLTFLMDIACEDVDYLRETLVPAK